MKNFLVIIICFVLFSPIFVKAQQEDEIIISPRIIDERVKVGDLLKYDIKIKNNSEHKVDIYAVLNDLSSTEGEIQFANPAELDKTTSLVRWIKFKRGVIDLMPGDETSVPLEIDINGLAVIGKRFARIAFPFGTNREIASKNINNSAQLLINIEVIEDIIEKTQIKNFSLVNNIVLSAPAIFRLKLNNFGNKIIVPRGSIYIYDRRGKEVAQLNANPDAESINTGEIWEKNIEWNDFKGLGKFKAKLEMEYGEKNKRDLQDTVFFWIFPWKILIAFFLGTFIFLTLMVVLIFKKTYNHQYHHHEDLPRKNEEKKTGGVINLKK